MKTFVCMTIFALAATASGRPQGYQPPPPGPQGFLTSPSGPQGIPPPPPGPQGFLPPSPGPQGFQPLHPGHQQTYASADAQYNFAWDVDAYDPHRRPLKYGQQEQRDGSITQGRYYVLLPDTRLMTVDYYVDQYGFHPTYSFEGEAVYPESAPAPAPPSPAYSSPLGK